MRTLRDCFVSLFIIGVVLGSLLLVVLLKSGMSIRGPWTWVIVLTVAAIGDALFFVIYQSAPQNQSPGKFLLQGVGWILIGVGGLSFLWGGRFINVFWNTDRTLAEMEGIVLAFVLGGLGLAAKQYGEPDEQDEGTSTPMHEDR